MVSNGRKKRKIVYILDFCLFRWWSFCQISDWTVKFLTRWVIIILIIAHIICALIYCIYYIMAALYVFRVIYFIHFQKWYDIPNECRTKNCVHTDTLFPPPCIWKIKNKWWLAHTHTLHCCNDINNTTKIFKQNNIHNNNKNNVIWLLFFFRWYYLHHYTEILKIQWGILSVLFAWKESKKKKEVPPCNAPKYTPADAYWINKCTL